MNTKNLRVETKTIVISQDNIDAAIVSFLYAVGAIPPGWDVLSTDLALPLNEDGYVEFDIDICKPVGKPKLRLVDKDYREENDNQLTLPLEHFEKITVDD